MFGKMLENELETSTAKLKDQTSRELKQNQVLQTWLSKPGETLKGMYRDPTG